jgi:hypothetical protein
MFIVRPSHFIREVSIDGVSQRSVVAKYLLQHS